MVPTHLAQQQPALEHGLRRVKIARSARLGVVVGPRRRRVPEGRGSWAPRRVPVGKRRERHTSVRDVSARAGGDVAPE